MKPQDHPDVSLNLDQNYPIADQLEFFNIVQTSFPSIHWSEKGKEVPNGTVSFSFKQHGTLQEE